MSTLLLATDLDRTVIPNGPEPESPQARPLFRHFANQPQVTLLYITGRDQELVQQAIDRYHLPLPAYAIGDVGTSIYRVGPSAAWQPVSAWQQEIAPDWQGKSWANLKQIFSSLSELQLQTDRPAQQNTFKLSYYTAADIDKHRLLDQLESLGRDHGLKASYIFSIDEQKNTGLLDILPKSATKLHALQFLRQQLNFSPDQTVFCGDSGNDIPALTSGLNAVMVKNTRPQVQAEVMQIAQEKNITDHVYTARGNFHGLNGNYASGVLEGAVHYFPAAAVWLQEND